jgi:NitT/TauT family transport system permease protein
MSATPERMDIAAPLSLAPPARRRWGVIAAQLATLAVFFLIWEWTARTKAIDPLFIGQPSKVFAYLVGAIGGEHRLLVDAAWTLGSTAVAFLIGSGFGLAFGLLFVGYPMLERFFDPLFSALNALPRIALAPLFLLWFGLGPASKIALGASLTFFIVLNSTIAGARSVDSDWLTLSRMLGASKLAMFFKVTLVSAVPTIFSGLRLGLIYALLGVIGGEIIAAQYGLGQQLTYLAGTFDTNGVFGVLFVLALIGVTLTWTMSAVENHLLRWR